MTGQNIFAPIPGGIPGNIPARNDHDAKRDHVCHIIHKGSFSTVLLIRIQVVASGPVETNKFYANLFLGNQQNSVFLHPYSVSWPRGSGVAGSYGLAISQIEASQISMGERASEIPGNPVRFFINPIGIHSIALSASEFGPSTALTVCNPTGFSADAVLTPSMDFHSNQSLAVPLVQGAGFITGMYQNLQPHLQTGIFFREFRIVSSPNPAVVKSKLVLNDGSSWLVYVFSTVGVYPQLTLESNSSIRGPPGFTGFIQIAKNPAGSQGETIFDRTAGTFATGMDISGSVEGDTGVYFFKWKKAGLPNTPLLMYALPHHIQSFDDTTRRTMTDVTLRTTTKGMATACVGDSWTMVETGLPISMGFAPWKSGVSVSTLSDQAKNVLMRVSYEELTQSATHESDLDSMYFSGKKLGKFAQMVHVVSELVGEKNAIIPKLEDLKHAFGRFINNQQRWPLVYDQVWGGVVSSGTYATHDGGLDFGNTYYNDHHFHYGYFILAGAILGYLDPSWLTEDNKAYVNMLVRDASNPVNDETFPFSRGFDWYNGHSWAKGIFESADGKDQESTSEDAMFAYAIKMWGKTIGDVSLEARGNLMIAILARAFRNYFLLESDNQNQPREFIPNKVTGIVSIADDIRFLLS